ncbi:hypothetical protein, unknown function [Leishmania tarentolae]|uniref:Transmembrane protein n=1 Tax=Leishmania tarentolae TaxID=5689 RepID=A0A640KMM1_LEITA|nr:hypothetical protein, unknown function [Leishmania tarentolae]
MHPHSLSQSNANVPTIVSRPTTCTQMTMADASQNSPSSRLSSRSHALPVAIRITHRSAATKLERSREHTPFKQGVSGNSSTHGTPPRRTSASRASVTRERSRSGMPLPKKLSLRQPMSYSVFLFDAHPLRVPSNTCLRSRLAETKLQQRLHTSCCDHDAPSVVTTGNCIPKLSSSNVRAVVENANEPFAEYARPSTASSNSSVAMPKAPRCLPTIVTQLPDIARTPPTIFAVVPRNRNDAARHTSSPLRVSPAPRRRSQPGLTYSPPPYNCTTAIPVSHEIPTVSTFLLPYCSDAQLRGLFAALLVRAGGTTWSVHENILPFLAARQHRIMPVASWQVSAFFGFTRHSDGDIYETERSSSASDPPGETAFSGGSWTNAEMSRFASQLCYWFVYVGILGCGEDMCWATLLMPLGSTTVPSRLIDVPTIYKTSGSSPPRSSVEGHSSPSVHSPTPEKQFLSPAPLSPLRHPPCVSSSTLGGDANEKGSLNSTVMYGTNQLESSTLDVVTTSTPTSVEFRAVVEAPPVVQEGTFVRGYKFLQTLLGKRGEQLADIKNDPMATAVRALCAAAGTGNGANVSPRDSVDRLSETLPPEAHLLYRRVLFYLRLHAFLREICAYLCAHERPPWQRESCIVASIISSRLRDMASRLSSKAPLVKKTAMTANSETSTGSGGRWGRLRDTLSQGVLHGAILAVPNIGAANSLKALFVLRHAGATRLVLHAAEGLPSAAGAIGQSSASASSISYDAPTLESGRGARLPAQLLRLFPLPRWSPLTQPGTALHKHLTTFDLVASRALGFALAWVALISCLFISGAHVLRTSRWVASLENRASGDTGHQPNILCRTWVHNLVEHCWTMLLLTCTARVAHHAGEVVASIEVMHTIVTSQSAALASESDGWLQEAWALQASSVVAAQAVQRCVQRLRLVCNAVDGGDGAPLGRRHALTHGMVRRCWRRVFAMALIPCAVEAFFSPSRYVVLAVVVMVAFGASVLHVCEARQQRRRALSWWLSCQASTAESFADELLRTAGAQCSEALSRGVDGIEQRGSVARPLLPANPTVVQLLCTISLPVLEELAKVACLVEWSEGRLLPVHDGNAVHGPAKLSALPIQWFWETVCGHAAPTYADDMSSAVVVETTMQTCRRALEAEQKQRGAAPLSVAEAVAAVLPWTLDYEAVPLQSTSALEGWYDYQVDEVLAPFFTAAAGEASGVAFGEPRGDFSPLHSFVSQRNGAKDAAIPLDVKLRRLPYLSQLQSRLVVCTAFVLASLRVAPRAMGTAGRCSSASFPGCVGESTLGLLTHLVHTQMYVESSPPHRKDSEAVSATQWRRAAKRTRDALMFLQQVTLSTQQREAHNTPSRRAHTLVLPWLLHELFR